MLLTAHADGLTTAGILKECENARYTGIKDIKMASNLIYNMRNQGYVITSDAVGGKIHRIARKGAEALNKETDQAVATDNDPNLPKWVGGVLLPDDRVITAGNDNQGYIITDEKNPLEAFDSAIKIMRDAMALALETRPLIADKDAKIAVLDKLQALMSPDIADVLANIRSDLDKFDEE